MSVLEACSCSLQARLHQVENARSREMKAHGELVQRIEHELESRRTSEAALRLTAAKLRTDNCRLEAKLCAANAKARQLREQLDVRSTESAQREDRLQAAIEKNNQLVEEKRQLHIELSESRTRSEEVKHQSHLLLTKNDELRLNAITQAAEVEKLSVQVTNMQQKLEAVAVRYQLLLEELASAREQQNLMQERTQELGRDITRAIVVRNRALIWRRKRQDAWDNGVLSRGAFLAWKSIAVQAGLSSAAKLAQCNKHNLNRLQFIEREVLKRCSQAKEDLDIIRQDCTSERARIQSLHVEFCQTELPKLLTLLDEKQKGFDKQRDHLELQLKNQLSCFESERDQLNMSRHDVEYRIQAQLARRKRQQHAILQTFTATRDRAFHRRTFSAWKEFYLRSVVGQATHTAMVFQSQQPQISTTDLSDSSDSQQPQSWAIPASIRPFPMAFKPLQLAKQEFSEGLRSPISDATTPIDSMWRKWRRVDVGATSKGHISRPNLPS